MRSGPSTISVGVRCQVSATRGSMTPVTTRKNSPIPSSSLAPAIGQAISASSDASAGKTKVALLYQPPS